MFCDFSKWLALRVLLEPVPAEENPAGLLQLDLTNSGVFATRVISHWRFNDFHEQSDVMKPNWSKDQHMGSLSQTSFEKVSVF